MTYLTRFGRARHVRRTRVLRLTVRAVVGGAPRGRGEGVQGLVGGIDNVTMSVSINV